MYKKIAPGGASDGTTVVVTRARLATGGVKRQLLKNCRCMLREKVQAAAMAVKCPLATRPMPMVCGKHHCRGIFLKEQATRLVACRCCITLGIATYPDRSTFRGRVACEVLHVLQPSYPALYVFVSVADGLSTLFPRWCDSIDVHTIPFPWWDSTCTAARFLPLSSVGTLACCWPKFFLNVFVCAAWRSPVYACCRPEVSSSVFFYAF